MARVTNADLTSQLDALRAENERLRSELAALRAALSVIRAALAQATGEVEYRGPG